MLAINILNCLATLKISPSSLIAEIWKWSYIKSKQKNSQKDKNKPPEEQKFKKP